jgi:hypothetical protein
VTDPPRGEPVSAGWFGGDAADAARRAARLLLLLGVAWRLLRYAQNFALAPDESYVALNLMDAGWADVFRPARAQAAPALFLLLEKAALTAFGPSEHGLRLLPLLAGLLGLGLFWRLANRALPPLSAALATGLLSVSYFPLRFSAEVKPYSLDLLAAVVLLGLGLRVREEPGRLRPLGILVFAAPLLVVLSYPSCLVVASVSAVLLPVVRRHPDRRVKALFAAYNLTAFAAFLASYLLVGVGQYLQRGEVLREFWQWHGSFPPAAPGPLLVWLFRLATGLVFAYPLGDVTGAAAVTFLLAVAGAVTLWRSGRRHVVALCLLPFAATFAVAALRLYPFGPHPRLAQHLAAPICLLAGAGIAALLTARSAPERVVLRRTRRVFALLAVIGIAGVTIDVLQPYRSPRDEAFRKLAAGFRAKAGPMDLVVYWQDPADREESPSPLEFDLRKERLRFSWSSLPDVDAPPRPRQVWLVAYRLPAPPEVLTKKLLGAAPPFTRVSEKPYLLQVGSGPTDFVRCSVSHWSRALP